MKKVTFIFATIALICFCSCSSDDASISASAKTVKLTECQRITQKLITEGSGHSYKEGMAETRLSRPNFSRRDGIKIAIADAIGGFKHSGFGPWGTIAGAVGSSLWKATKIYAMQQVTGYFRSPAYLNTPSGSYREGTLEDSLGYYHNVAEYALYQQYPDAYTMSTSQLMNCVDNMMRSTYAEYNLNPLSTSQLQTSIEILDAMNSIDSSLDFEDYCECLCEEFPESEDAIVLIAQYLYEVFYADAMLDEITLDLLDELDSSDMDYEEMIAIRRAVIIAYSSILYNNTMTYANL